MSSSEKPNRKLADTPEEYRYKKIDPVSIVALVCGVLSFMAIVFSPVFFLFGILGVFFGFGSLYRINSSDNTLSGYGVAAAAIGFSLLFGSSYLTYSLSRSNTICRQAREHAESWIQMIQDGNYREAHQLTKRFLDRQLPGTDLAAYYDPNLSKKDILNATTTEGNSAMSAEGTPYEQMSGFYSGKNLKTLKEMRHDCEVKFISFLANFRKGNRKDFVDMAFAISYEENGKQISSPLAVRMFREVYPENSGVHWAVDFVE